LFDPKGSRPEKTQLFALLHNKRAAGVLKVKVEKDRINMFQAQDMPGGFQFMQLAADHIPPAVT
jgi:hypothetical protein